MTGPTLTEMFAKHRLFADMDPELVSVLAECAHDERFPAGSTIIEEGAPANRCWVLREGRVALQVRAPSGPPIVLVTLGPGHVLGWSWLFPPYRWHFDARAVTDVDAIALDAACVRGHCDSDSQLGYELMKRFVAISLERLQATRLQLLDLYAAEPPEEHTGHHG